MTSKQEARETTFHQAEKAKQGLIRQVEMVGYGEIKVRSWLAAIILRFPKKFLEDKGLFVIGDKDETKIVISKDPEDILKKALVWMSEDESEKTQRRILGDLYNALYQIGQASVAPSVEIAQVVRPHLDSIDLALQKFPFLEDLKGVLTPRKEGIRLETEDEQILSGIATSIFEQLKLVQDPRVKGWEATGRVPENMFASPGNA